MIGLILALYLAIAGAITPATVIEGGICAAGETWNPASLCQLDEAPPGMVRAEDGSYIPAIPGAIN